MSAAYVIRVCPECGEQETYYAEHDAPTTFCLNHEDEPGRETRPTHVPKVVTLDSADGVGHKQEHPAPVKQRKPRTR